MDRKDVHWTKKSCSAKIIFKKSEIRNICNIRINIWSNCTKHLVTRRYINIWDRKCRGAGGGGRSGGRQYTQVLKRGEERKLFFLKGDVKSDKERRAKAGNNGKSTNQERRNKRKTEQMRGVRKGQERQIETG